MKRATKRAMLISPRPIHEKNLLTTLDLRSSAYNFNCYTINFSAV